MICKIRLGVENMKEIAGEMPLRTIPLLKYVERVYVGSEGSPARFPPSTRNVHLQTLPKGHKTNNLFEGWNKKFHRLVGYLHPTTWNCIAALPKDEICSRRTIIHFEIDEEEPRQHSAVYYTVDARLHHLCIRYGNCKILRLAFFTISLLQPTATEIVAKNGSSSFF